MVRSSEVISLFRILRLDGDAGTDFGPVSFNHSRNEPIRDANVLVCHGAIEVDNTFRTQQMQGRTILLRALPAATTRYRLQRLHTRVL